MHSQEQCSTPPFRMLSLVMMIAAFLATVVPLVAQNAVPPTAVQAAKTPRFASRLAHPAKRMTPPKSPVFAQATKHSRPLDSNDIYDNGPINGNTDAWGFNYGFIVSDSFNVASDQTQITGMSFGAWLTPGDTLISAELSITSSEFGGTSYFDQTVNFTQSNCVVNSYGYNVCTETGSFTGPSLNAGTYWVNLQNASIPSGDPVFWDENSGMGCQGQGCPSLASENSVGSIPSEAFTILGETTTTTTSNGSNYACPRPQPGFHDLYNVGGSSAVTVRGAGNLYGAFGGGGSHGAGFLYDLAQRAGHWFLSSLYSFLGGSQGYSPNGPIFGPSGALYGSAWGGWQNCGSDGTSYCGLIYEAKPGPASCANALCGWNETTIYQFTGNTDAANGNVTAFDSLGNLYGISGAGAYGQGAVFELSPAQGGWIEKILYNFTGGSDGSNPSSLLVGHDGTLYGTAMGGGVYGSGAVFQLVPASGGWTENVLYSFMGTTDGFWPNGLVQDKAGNLYGFDICYHYGYFDCSHDFYDDPYGLVFELSPYDGGWLFGVYYNNNGDCDTLDNFIHALAMDENGNLYVAEGGTHTDCSPSGCYTWNCGNIMKVSQREFLISGDADIFYNLSSDANGNLYGTTQACGVPVTPFSGSGMIWQYSP